MALWLPVVSQAARAQSLEHLAAQALAHDTAWRSAGLASDAAASRTIQARAGLLPTVGLQASSQYGSTRVQGQFPGSPRELHAWQHSAGLQVAQPLYRPASLATWRQSQHAAEVARAQQEAARQELLVTTAQAYFDVLTARDTLTVVRAQQQAVAGQLAYAQRNFDLGIATITDAREAQARFDLVQAHAIGADNDLRVKQLALEQVTGVVAANPWPLALHLAQTEHTSQIGQQLQSPIHHQPAPQQPLQPDATGASPLQHASPSAPLALSVPRQWAELRPTHLEHWLQQAQATHPALQQARLAVDIARLEAEKARAGHLPVVELQASYGIQRTPDGTMTLPYNARTHASSVIVTATVPLFAGHAVQSRVSEALVLEEKAGLDAQTAQRRVAQAVRAAYYGVQSAWEQVQAMEAAVASSHSALQASELGYANGVRINLDVLNAQSQWYQARKDLAAARYRVLLGYLQLRQAAGLLQWEDVQAVSGFLQPPS